MDSAMNFVEALGKPSVEANWDVLVTIRRTVIMPISVWVIRRLTRAKAAIPTRELKEVSKTRRDAPLTIFVAESLKSEVHLATETFQAGLA